MTILATGILYGFATALGLFTFVITLILVFALVGFILERI